MDEKDKERHKKKVIGITFMIVVVVIIALVVIFVPEAQDPITNITENKTENVSNVSNNMTEGTEIPFLQRLVLLIKYNETECPNLALNLTKNNESYIVEIEKVENIDENISFARLGRYDTNSEPLIEFSFVNYNNCEPDYLLITNNEFISLLLELGVTIEQKEPIEEA